MKNKKILSKGLRTLFTIILICLLLFPVLIMISTSLKTYQETLAWPPTWFNPPLAWENFTEVTVGDKSIMPAFYNSLIVSVIVMILCILIGSLAAYSVTRFDFVGRKTFLILIIATQMFSPVLLVNPMYIIFRKLGLLNTLTSLIIANTAASLPMTIWLLYSYFSQIPIDYEEAAWMDGSSRLRAIFDVVLPLAIPGIITAGLFAFIGSWGDIVFAKTFVLSDSLRTISQSLADYQDLYKVSWELQMAASLVTTLPPFLIFLGIQKQLIKGMTQDGVKG